MDLKKESLILIVDDNTLNLQVLGNLLRENNYKSVAATNGFKALELVNKKLPDLILLDLMMPEMDGLEVCKRLKENNATKDIPVIFLTAKTEIEDLIKGFQLGGVDYITKPFNKQELLARLKTHVDLKRAKDIIIEQNESLIKLNEELKRVNELLSESNATKDKLFSIIGHDLRGPIGNFSAMLRVIVSDTDLMNEKTKMEFLNAMLDSAENTFILLENLLDWARSQRDAITLNFENLKLFPIFADIIDFLIGTARKKNITFSLTISHDLKAFFDQNTLSTVARNLISNSLKFTPENGKIEISAVQEENIVKVSIIDNGVGIKEENIKKIFQKNQTFTTVGTSGERGTGLGLILCKEFIEKNNGKIWVDSIEGKGTTFFFTLPKS